MNGHLDQARVRIDAPDAPRAFRLEHRLRHLHAVAVGRGPRWEVDVETFDGEPDEIAAAVGAWLGDVGIPGTTVRLDGEQFSVLRSS